MCIIPATLLAEKELPPAAWAAALAAPAAAIFCHELPHHLQHVLLSYTTCNARSCNLHHDLTASGNCDVWYKRCSVPTATPTPKAAASSNGHSPYEQNPGPGMSTPKLPHRCYVGGYCQQQLQPYEHRLVPSAAPTEAATPVQRLLAASNNCNPLDMA